MNLLEQLVAKYRAVVRVFRDSDGLKIEPFMPAPYMNDQTVRIYISKPHPAPSLTRRERIGMTFTEDEAIWLMLELESILKDDESQ